MIDTATDLDSYEYILNHYGLESLEKIGYETGKSVNAIKQIVARLKSRGELAKNEKEHATMLLNEKKEEIQVLQATVKFYQSACKEFTLLSDIVLKQINS
ncbi:hypothetical protein [Piscirickettsia salmonis]|uniref:Uncharacterized protein n=1 Tax=Piscirickettsia salmonis TaxID=1238 RepID=A0A9Q5YKE3_PISSA|nr:hypothetical protein [Piscirickettsia salmonis]APS59068.1 hypothetical protein AVI52_17690 [Piscirickettsia salmonis]ERL61877.1 hypothetical protein K661_01778 [Piscirickettsia salmonis LF-89 = ATCC VR-1361]PEQ16268.1 hypothetical protein X973_08300 [Piscirickettsia salmonis]QGN79260.1 hypothetical protein Psal001_03525 [Piscirickettsia salmonis]QGN82851.1 hypothetical protein Psal002_03551 [Piscirickettsia salmonis]